MGDINYFQILLLPEYHKGRSFVLPFASTRKSRDPTHDRHWRYRDTRRPKLPCSYHAPITRFRTLSLLSSYHHQQHTTLPQDATRPSSIANYCIMVSRKNNISNRKKYCHCSPKCNKKLIRRTRRLHYKKIPPNRQHLITSANSGISHSVT